MDSSSGMIPCGVLQADALAFAHFEDQSLTATSSIDVLVRHPPLASSRNQDRKPTRKFPPHGLSRCIC